MIEIKDLVLGSVLIGLLGIILIFGVMDKRYRAKLVFINKKNNVVVYENRSIPKGETIVDRVENLVEELLLNSMNPNFKYIFPQESKIINTRLINDEIYLNFNKEVLNNADSFQEVVTCVTKSIFINFRSIKTIYFLFNGKEQGYFGYDIDGKLGFTRDFDNK